MLTLKDEIKIIFTNHRVEAQIFFFDFMRLTIYYLID